MNICIIGGGPTGLRVADKLTREGFNIELYEREENLGGCWKVDWDDGYYREHAPRVLTTNYNRTLKLCNKLKVKTGKVYGNKLYTYYMFFNFFVKHFTSTDFISMIGATRFMNKKDTRTLEKWMDDEKISDNARSALRKFALSIATNEKEILAYSLFDAIYQGENANFLQFKENDLWIKRWEEDLLSRPNLKIIKGSSVSSFKMKGENITSCKIGKTNIVADYFVCCIPLYSLKEILNKSSEKIQNNWSKIDNFDDYCTKSSYSGLGFQLHFKNKLNIIPTWNSDKFTDWSIEVIDIGKYSDNISKNESIRQVLSCVIVDTNAKSTILDKSPNDISDIDLIITEAIRQLSISNGLSIIPDKVTISDGLKYNKSKSFWDMKYSAFHPTNQGELKPNGDIENLFSVGPHNIYEVASLENALKSADIFSDEFIKSIKDKEDTSIDIRTLIIPQH